MYRTFVRVATLLKLFQKQNTLKQVLEKIYILEELTRGDNFHNMKNIHRYFVFVH